MKKIIRWLSDISGVSKDIKIETIKEVGGNLKYDSTFYTSKERAMTGNTLLIYGISMSVGTIPDTEKVRYTVDDFKTDSLHLEENSIYLQKVAAGIHLNAIKQKR